MADKRKVAMDEYVRQHGTGAYVETNGDTKRYVINDTTVYWNLVSQILDWQDSFISLARKKSKVEENVLSDEEAYNIFLGDKDGVDFILYLLATYDDKYGASISTYIIDQLRFKFLDYQKSRFDKSGALIQDDSYDAMAVTDGDGVVRTADDIIGQDDEDLRLYEFGEELIEFCSNMLEIVNACGSTKEMVYRMLYTDLYLTIAKRYLNIDISHFRHRRELAENLDNDMIDAIYEIKPESVIEMIKNKTKTIEALSNYYGDKTKKYYSDIFTVTLRGKESFKEEIPFPIKPADIFRACLYIKENKDASEEQMESYSRAANIISKYRTEFDESITTHGIETFGEMM